MGSDYKVLLDVEEGLITPAGVTVVRETPSAGARWRVCGAVLAMALCVSAALFFTWHHQKQHHDEEADDLRHTLREISGVKAAIHLDGKYDKASSTLQWNQTVNQAFAQGGLELKNNEIVIPKTGLYFVYSQVSFSVECKTTGKNLVHLSQIVMRLSNSYGSDESLLHSKRTTCESLDPKQQGRSFSTVYAGATFLLEEGDRLKTEVAKLPLVSGKNFFGVFAL